MASIFIDTTLRPILGTYGKPLGDTEARLRGISHMLQQPDIRLHIGRVTTYNPQLHVHMVKVAGHGDLVCTALDVGGKALTGAHRTSVLYGPGATVLLLTGATLGVGAGVILGSWDNYLPSTENTDAIELIAGTPAGGLKDSIAAKAFNTVAYNYNGGRALDAFAGDHVSMNEFGVGHWQGRLMTAMRAGHDCSVECHYVDSLLRLTGFNFEQFTAGSELTAMADVGDYTEIRRSNPYVLESLGANTQYGKLPAKAGSDAPGKFEPTGALVQEVEQQTGYWRSLELTGYLGNLYTRFVTVPAAKSTRTATAGQQDEYGVFREHIDATGAWSVTSAKSIVLAKDCLIPVPKELLKPDSGKGATQAELLTARTDNEPYIKDMAVAEPTSLSYAAATNDVAAHQVNRATATIAERPKDWQLQLMEDLEFADIAGSIGDTGYIATSISTANYHAPLPKVGKLQITQREDATYYASRSLIVLHEDGAIHIQDGYGASISLRAGSIDLSCPGDITLRPGRSQVTIAGDTISMQAGIDLEQVAMAGDVRVHGNRNVNVLAGTDGAGGILLETRASSGTVLAEFDGSLVAADRNANAYGGIWLKAPDAGVAAMARQCYVGSAAGASVVLDAGVGGSVYTKGASTVLATTASSVLTNPDNPESGIQLTWSGSSMLLSTSGNCALLANAFIFGGKDGQDSNLQLAGNMLATGSVSAQGFAGISSAIAQLDEDSFNETGSQLSKATSDVQTSTSEFGSALAEQVQQFANSMAGNSDYYDLLKFAYPDSDLRGIPTDVKYLLVESQWQQLYRTGGKGSTLTFVDVDGTRPWPGTTAGDKFGQLAGYDSRLVDDKLRAIKKPLTEPVVVLDAPVDITENYTVIGQNIVRSK